jgi:hypothetical protein
MRKLFGMKLNLRRAGLLTLLLCLSVVVRATAAHGQSPAATATKTGDAEVKMIEPSDLFRGFPAVAWGMSFADARRAIEKAGARPVRAHERDVSELVWTGKFEGMDGRARVHFKEGGGLDDVAVGVYAFERRGEVFDAWLRRLTGRHGKAAEESDNETYTSKVWRLGDGFVIELRSLKDPNSPVVDIHWVKL